MVTMYVMLSYILKKKKVFGIWIKKMIVIKNLHENDWDVVVFYKYKFTTLPTM